ncbi:hypothetical protein GW17_00055596 [Ensete ventricosum]|nr:hypothetical protein GW17_00055596 [Ensete ventricosum]
MLRWTDFRAAATAIECRRGSTEMDGWWWWRREGESAAIRYFSRYYPLEIILPNKSSDDAVGTHREIVGSSLKVIGGLPGVCQELAKGDQECVGSLLEDDQVLVGSSPEDVGKFVRNSKDQLICQTT